MVDSLPCEQILAVIPDASGHQRMVFATRPGDPQFPIVLRQESYSRDVGWFPQSHIEMTRQQMVLLRSALGGSASPMASAPAAMPSAPVTPTPAADSAARSASCGQCPYGDSSAEQPSVLSFAAAANWRRKGA